MNRRPIAIALVAATAAAIGVYWLTDWPLGVRGEWTWDRIPHPPSLRGDSLLGICQGLLAATAFVLVARTGGRLISRSGRFVAITRLACLSTLVAAGFLWLHILQESAPSGHGLSKAPWVVFYPGSSGYYFEARYRMDSIEEFLDSYENLLNDPDPARRTLHLGTHPPGLFLFHHAVLETCRQSAELRRSLIAWQPGSVRQALDTISDADGRLGELDRAALWLAALVTQLAAVATILPLYALVRVDHSAKAAWRACVIWPLVPAVAIFLPKSDCLYPLLATTAAWLWWSGVRKGGWWRPCLAGVTLWLGLFLSLAFLPVVALGGGLAAWARWRGTLPRRRLAGFAIGTLVGLAIPSFACWLAWGLNLPSTWWSNLANHAAFYDQPQHPRHYISWLWTNPLELVLAAGVPLAGLTVAGFFSRVRRGTPAEAGPAWICLIVWAALWISGKNMGEAARLWLFLMPWGCWLAATVWQEIRTRDWVWLLALQAILAVATVSRVSGFHFAS